MRAKCLALDGYFGIGLFLKFLDAESHLGGVLGRPSPQTPHAAAALKMGEGDAVHTRVPGTEQERPGESEVNDL